MGNWHISIRGIGPHHNQDNPKDADKMAKEFVSKLKAAGQSVTVAVINFGGEESINAK